MHRPPNDASNSPRKQEPQNRDHSRRRRSVRERLAAAVNPGTILAAAVLAVFIVAAVVLGNSLDVSLFSAEGARKVIDMFGPWAPVGFVVVLAITVVISHLPGLPLSIAAGAMWGPVGGTALAVSGGLLGSIVAYLIGRYLGGSIVHFFTGRRVAVTEEKGRRVAGLTVFVSRLIPLMPFDIISYGAGLARVPALTYVIATLTGMAPSTFLLTYLGASITDVSWITIVLTVAAAVAFVGVPLYCRRREPNCLAGILTWHAE